MLESLAVAGSRLASYSDFWLVSALGDCSFEEGERNKPHFPRYLESWADPEFPLPPTLVTDVRAGINDVLYGLVCQQPGVKPYQRNKSNGHDIVVLANGRPVSVEVKYLFDCTLAKYYGEVRLDREKAPDYQVVFFLSFPNYERYTGGNLREIVKINGRVGVAEQYAKVSSSMFLGPASWPSDPPHTVYLPQGTEIITEDRIRRRCRRRYGSRMVEEFCAASHLSGAQVGFAIWDWSAEK